VLVLGLITWLLLDNDGGVAVLDLVQIIIIFMMNSLMSAIGRLEVFAESHLSELVGLNIN